MRKERRDGVRIDGLDGYHNILPYIMPKRTEAEVSMTEVFNVTELLQYMKERNEKEGLNLKFFHAFCTAVARTIYLRPMMNIFIETGKIPQKVVRNLITLGCITYIITHIIGNIGYCKRMMAQVKTSKLSTCLILIFSK